MHSRNVAIIGAGQLGSRHLQGLLSYARPLHIYMVDPSALSLDRAKSRVKEVRSSADHEVVYYSSIDELPSQLDLAIISTNADIRRTVTEELLREADVRYLVFEKVLFQSLEDYDAIAALLKEKSVKAWVNCPRRMWESYIKLWNRVQGITHLSYAVSGTSWGLGSNAIHFLDHFGWLTEDYEIDLDFLLHKDLASNKRKGFVEFNGTLYGRSKNGFLISLTSYANGNIPLSIQIDSDRVRCVINESQGQGWIATPEDDWQWQAMPFGMEYQSILTGKLAKGILEEDGCILPTFDESKWIHKKLIEGFIKHLESISGKRESVCPIT